MPYDVIGVGANSMDFVYRLPGRPAFEGVNNKLRIRSRTTSCGGQVATALAACAALGLRTAYVGATGSDTHGGTMRAELARRGIDLAHAVVRECDNPYAVILVDDRTGERLVFWDRPAPLALDPEELPLAVIRSARLLHVDDVDPRASIRAAQAARAAGIPVTSDLEAMSEWTAELVRSVTVPIFAEHLPSQLTGEDDLEQALRRIRREHDGLLCVTLGVRGAMLLDGDALLHAPALPVHAVDTTGAGDVFRAGFIYGMLTGLATAAVLRVACAAAALSCTKHGAMASVPTREELDTYLVDPPA